MIRGYLELYRKFNESLYFDHHLIKETTYTVWTSWEVENQIQISEKYQKPTSRLYYERYFNKSDFDWKLTSFDTYGNCQHKIKSLFNTKY